MARKINLTDELKKCFGFNKFKGNQEALKYELSGMWSRRINAEHRIIYKVLGEVVEVQIMSMRYHYVKA